MTKSQVEITDISYGIYGVGMDAAAGKKVLVELAVPGDVVSYTVSKEKEDLLYATIDKLITPSPLRDTRPHCPHFGKCGGCTFGDLSPISQEQVKKQAIYNECERLNIDKDKINFHSMSGELGYRITSRFHFTKDGYLGFSMLRSNAIQGISECPVCVPGINRIIRRWNSIVNRSGPLSDKLKEIKVTSTEHGEGIEYFFDSILSGGAKRINKISRQLGLAGWVITDRQRRTISMHEKKLELHTGGQQFRFYPSSFVQANPKIAVEIAEFISENIRQKGLSGDLVDLYSGFGFFAAFLREHARRIYLVENSYSGTNDARGVFADDINVSYLDLPVEEGLLTLKKRKISPTVLILDPPRKSPGKEIFGAIASLKPEVIYFISCNPSALLRSVKQFKNYKLESINIFNMFPYTYHSEAVGIFVPKFSDG